MIDWNMYLMTKDNAAGPIIQIEPSPFEANNAVDPSNGGNNRVGYFVSLAIIVSIGAVMIFT